MSLDALLGGGLLEGRVIEAWGDESSGKTTCGIQVASSFVTTPGDVGVVVDFEHTYVPTHGEAVSGIAHVHLGELQRWLSQQGRQPAPVIVWFQPGNAEEGADLLFGLSDLFKDRLRFVILDSLAAMTPREVMERGMTERTFASQANFMTTFMNKLTKVFAERRTTTWGCNQDRANINAGPFAPKLRAAGARIIRFAASQRLHFSRGEGSHYKTEIPGSHTLYIKVDKNKTSPDRRGRTRLLLWPGRGFSREVDVLDLALQYGVLRGGGPGMLRFSNGAQTSQTALLEYLCDPLKGPQIMSLLRAKLAEAVPDGKYAFKFGKQGED